MTKPYLTHCVRLQSNRKRGFACDDKYVNLYL